jgi:hypothetical protein
VRAHTGTAHPATALTAPPPDTNAHTAQYHTTITPPAAHNRVCSPPPAPIAHSGRSATSAQAHSGQPSDRWRSAHTTHNHSLERRQAGHHAGETAIDLVDAQVQIPVVRAHTGAPHHATPLTAPPPDTNAHTAQYNTTNNTTAAHNRVRRPPPPPPSHTAAAAPLAHSMGTQRSTQ